MRLLDESVVKLQSAKSYRALLRIGWVETHIVKDSSHQQLKRPGYPDFTWAFHDADEIGPRMLARIAKRTGLTPEDLKHSRLHGKLETHEDRSR